MMPPKAKTAPAEKSVNAPPTATPGIQQTSTLPVVQTPSSSLATAMPSWLAAEMGDRAPRGLELVDKQDLTYPRLVLVQGMTKGVSTGEANVGEMRDNISNDLLCARGEKLEIIPVIYNKSRIEFGPEIGDPIVCRSRDSLKAQKAAGVDQGGVATNDCSKCIKKDWDDSVENGVPACTEFHNILCLLPQHGMRAIVVSFKSSAAAVGKRFLSALAQINADCFALKFSLWGLPETSGDGKHEYMNFEFSKIGFVSQAEFKVGQALYSQMFKKEWAADTTDLEEAVVEAPEPGSDVETPASEQTVDAAPPTGTPPPQSKSPADVAF